LEEAGRPSVAVVASIANPQTHAKTSLCGRCQGLVASLYYRHKRPIRRLRTRRRNCARRHLRDGKDQQQRWRVWPLMLHPGCSLNNCRRSLADGRASAAPSASAGRRPQARPCVVPIAGSASERTKAIAGPRRRGLDDKSQGPIDHLRHRVGAPSAHQSYAIARSCPSGTMLVSCRWTGHAETARAGLYFPGRALMTRCGAPTSEELSCYAQIPLMHARKTPRRGDRRSKAVWR
jgi:hypothetical protein